MEVTDGLTDGSAVALLNAPSLIAAVYKVVAIISDVVGKCDSGGVQCEKVTVITLERHLAG